MRMQSGGLSQPPPAASVSGGGCWSTRLCPCTCLVHKSSWSRQESHQDLSRFPWGCGRELGSRDAPLLTPPAARCAGPSVLGGVGNVKGTWAALAVRPQWPWSGLGEGQRGGQPPTFSKDAQGLLAGWEHVEEVHAVGTQSPPRCCVHFRPVSAPLATGSGEDGGVRLAKVGCAQKEWQPEPGFLAAGSAGQEASGLHQALPEPRSSVLKKGKRQLLLKVAVMWGSVVRALFGLGRLDPVAWGQGVRPG